MVSKVELTYNYTTIKLKTIAALLANTVKLQRTGCANVDFTTWTL